MLRCPNLATAERTLTPKLAGLAVQNEYAAMLAKFVNLKFFAWDRRAGRADPVRPDPVPPITINSSSAPSRLKLEYEALSALGRAVPSLQESVAITQDVSEGSRGYFATYERVNGSVRITVRRDTAQDFLVSFPRWCVVADD